MNRYKLIIIIIFLIISAYIFPGKKVIIYAPETPSSIPLIFAVKNMPDTEIVIFNNHSQANALFLKGDVEILTTGLSVGLNFFKNKAPAVLINSYVSGLTYMVTYGNKVNSFKELSGSEIYLPFQNSPIEEITKFFIEKEGLKWEDFKIIYSQFQSSFELLKSGKASAVPLPEPFVSMIESSENIKISFGYSDKWSAAAGGKNGYPQVGTFVKKEWLDKNKIYINRLNREIEKAVIMINRDPAVVKNVKDSFKLPENILMTSAKRTSFYFLRALNLKKEIENYYKIIGKPLDESYKEFFYIY